MATVGGIGLGLGNRICGGVHTAKSVSAASNPAVFVYQNPVEAESSVTINGVIILASMDSKAQAQEVIAAGWTDPVTVNWSCSSDRFLLSLAPEGSDASGTNLNAEDNFGTITVTNWDGSTDPIYISVRTKDDT